MYAKLISETQIEYAQKSVIYEHKRYINPSVEILTELGYMELIQTDMPSEEGYYYTSLYRVDDGKIIQLWESHELEPSAPTELEMLEAQVVYTAMMTDTLLETDGDLDV